MATRSNTGKVLLASAVAGILALGAVGTVQAAEGEGAKVKCYGANKCKGQGGCAGAGHACAGKNACKGQGFSEVESKDACLKMEGGRLTPDKG
ncbi:MAG: hypothetical protein HYR72_10555 [Deltaproteobacteria bacterium]|nr:hypothetical protein [Deltaproteobacteria bacterium]MBI3388144.1 hypothetical protein [Deltaproteobacteria bacterium]